MSRHVNTLGDAVLHRVHMLDARSLYQAKGPVASVSLSPPLSNIYICIIHICIYICAWSFSRCPGALPWRCIWSRREQIGYRLCQASPGRSQVFKSDCCRPVDKMSEEQQRRAAKIDNHSNQRSRGQGDGDHENALGQRRQRSPFQSATASA